jgi:hypothetical protein
MSSIIINSFYRALCSINDYTPIKDMDIKKLAVTLVDALYPEDGYVTLEDNPRGNFRIHMNDQFMDRMRAEVAKGLTVAEAIETTGLKEEKQEVTVPVAVPEVKEVKVEPPKPKKPKAAPKPKLTPEEEAAAKAEKEAKAAADKAAKEAEKEAKKAADKAAKEEAKKIPKPKFVGNIEKLNPTQDKMWKKIAADANVELTDDHKKRFITTVNALDNTVYNQKKLEVHMAEFFVPKPAETKEEAMVAVDFEGKEYWVNKAGVVHETFNQENGDPIDKKVGHVGMAGFADMKMPADEDFE